MCLKRKKTKCERENDVESCSKQSSMARCPFTWLLFDSAVARGFGKSIGLFLPCQPQ